MALTPASSLIRNDELVNEPVMSNRSTGQSQGVPSGKTTFFYSRKNRILVIFLMVLFGGNLAFNRSQAAPSLRISDIPRLSFDGVSRLLVLAPHPDDETLSAGGIIQKALVAGIKVRVIILTNGDGQALAPLALHLDLLPRPNDYIAGGKRRQSETLNSLKILGLSSSEVTFLGYPDGQLNQLWLDNWNQACPLRARFPRSRRSSLPLTSELEKSFCGKNLVSELQTIIEEYKPDLVVLPHPNDTHPDHRATTSFILMAFAQERAFSPEYQPLFMSYLLHYGYFPQVRGWHLTRSILPPDSLSGTGNQWHRVDLSEEQVNRKAQAIRAFPTQIRMLGYFLPSFARSDEIFASLDILDISPLTFNNLSLRESGIIQSPEFPEPMEESARKVLIGGADLVALNVTRLGSLIWLTAETRSSLLPGLKYRLHVKLSNGETKDFTWPGSAIRTGRSTFSMKINLEDLPDVIGLGFMADIQQGVILDRTGWRFMVLRDRIS
jgi:LmbE family N-acetylglucosaminyl deacetylase